MEDSNFKAQPPRLEKPVRITEQVWPEGTVPVLSICCITFNHEQFVRETIEGFLMQETTFPVEIAIHDDASSDMTVSIVQDYSRSYPGLFRLVLRRQNQFQQSGYAFLWEFLAEARGEFIAVCEGDDYWTSIDKLELQVQKLVKDPQAAFCGGKTRIVKDVAGELVEVGTIKPARIKSSYQLNDILKHYSFHTSTFIFRPREILPKLKSATFANANGDEVMLALCAAAGPVLYVDKYLSVYRLHSGGVWAGETAVRRWRKGFDTLSAIDTHFGFRHRSALLRRQKRNVVDVTRELSNHGDREGVAQVLQQCRQEVATFGWSFPRMLEMLSGWFLLRAKWNGLRQRVAVRTRLRGLTAALR